MSRGAQQVLKQLTRGCDVFVCISAGKMAIPTLWEFFERYPSADVTRASDWRPLALLLQPLGLSTLRAKTLIRFSGASLADHLSDKGIQANLFNKPQ